MIPIQFVLGWQQSPTVGTLSAGWHSPSDGDAQNMANDMLSGTHATITAARGIYLAASIPMGVPGRGAYAPLDTCARLDFDGAGGAVVPLLVPGASPGCYLTDNETVDPSGLLAALIADCVMGMLVDRAGNAVAGYRSGHKIQVPLPPLGRWW